MKDSFDVRVSPLRPRRADALDSLAARGLKLVDVFPFKSGGSKAPTDHYHGPLPIFLDVGFAF